MIVTSDNDGGKPDQRRRESEMQAMVTRDYGAAEHSDTKLTLFDLFWEDVSPLNNYSPEAAQALLARETALSQNISPDHFASDPWFAVHAALRERAAGRRIARSV